MARLRPLTERDLETLAELAYCTESLAKRCGADYAADVGFAPLEFGGSNGSHHGKTATKLVAHGFVEHKQRGHDWGDITTRDARGSKVYRATDAGREAVKAWWALKNGYTSGGMKQKWGHSIPTTRHLTDDEKAELRRKCHLGESV